MIDSKLHSLEYMRPCPLGNSSHNRIGFSPSINSSHNGQHLPLFSLQFLSEWHMDELGRSSGVNNGSIGLAFDAVLRSNSNASHHHRRHTSDTGYGLLHARGHGSFKSCQNLTDRPRISPPKCSTAGNSTARLHLPLHVRPMSNLQASHEPSLPNLQPLRKSDGPPLPLDE